MQQIIPWHLCSMSDQSVGKGCPILGFPYFYFGQILVTFAVENKRVKMFDHFWKFQQISCFRNYWRISKTWPISSFPWTYHVSSTPHPLLVVSRDLKVTQFFKCFPSWWSSKVIQFFVKYIEIYWNIFGHYFATVGPNDLIFWLHA